jgi:chromosome segregation ATPase
MSSSSSNLTTKYDEERSRAAEQSQIVYLQGQIDELRRIIKDQNNKYNWVIEQTRKTESVVGQIEGLFERHQEETARTIERSRRDIVELRKEVSNALVKIEEGVKPLREMQSQIHQLAEARKQDRDQVFPWFARIEELEEKLPSLFNQIRESEDRHRQISMQLDRLRDADAIAQQEARRVGEELQVEKQSLRRQIVETQQLMTEVHEIFKEHDARIVRVDDVHEQIKLFAETLPGQIAEFHDKVADVATEIKRVENAATDWFMMNQERLEDLRQQSNEQLGELRDTDAQHLTQLTSWLERLDSWVRELEQRLVRGVSRVEAAQHLHAARVTELEHREIQSINKLAAAFREQAEAVQSQQVKARGLEGDTSTQGT